ncbi:MAG TPA: hypothetical protein PK014_04670 [Thermoanaerobaculia bacterium]|nr:hypothetical protein [Thermoanaerobaculia bacterium]HXK67941.1 hypothetical protein [Thermoanaerobaculia bacterium]
MRWLPWFLILAMISSLAVAQNRVRSAPLIEIQPVQAPMAGGGSTPMWEKQGVVSGSVNDIFRFPSQVDIWIATEAGIYSSWDPYDNTISWSSYNNGLVDLSVKKLTGVNGTPDGALAALAGDGVYGKISYDPGWVWADTAGLEDGSGNQVGYRDAVSIAMAPGWAMSTWDVYLAIRGVGIFTRTFSNNMGQGSWVGPTVTERLLDPDGAESGMNNWEVTGSWYIDSCWYYSPGHAYKAGQVGSACYYFYDNNEWSTLTLAAPIDLGSMPGHGYHLYYNEYYDTRAQDFCTPQISTDGGMIWSNLLPPYSGPPFGWSFRDIDLSSYTGNNVKIRFLFTSDSADTAEGWYLDEIEISRETVQSNDWVLMDTQGLNLNLNDIFYDVDRDLLFAATETSGPDEGNIFAWDGSTWSALATTNIDYLSVTGVPYDSMYGTSGPFDVLAGTRDEGVFLYDGSSFTPYCGGVGFSIPAGDFIDVSVDPQTGAKSVAATREEIYALDSCATGEPYMAFPGFRGFPKSVHSDACQGSGGGGGILVGTVGTGLVVQDCDAPAAPPIPLGNEGQMAAATDPILTKNVSRLAISPTNPPVFFASSLTDGMYKSRYGIWNDPAGLGGSGYFVRYFYDPRVPAGTPSGVKGTCVAIHPAFDDSQPVESPGKQTLYLGTTRNGIYRSDDGGSSWIWLNTFPPGDPVVDIVLSPGFSSDSTLFAMTRLAKVYRSEDAGLTWALEVSFPQPPNNTVVPIGYDLEISPSFPSDDVLFAATVDGLYKRTGQSSWSNVTSAQFPGIPILSVAVSPFFDNGYMGTNSEYTSVMAGSSGLGLLYSVEKGSVGSYAQVQIGSTGIIPIVRMHPALDANSTPDLLTYFYGVSYNATIGTVEGLYWTSLNQAQGTWTAPVDADPFMNFWNTKITDLAFDPRFHRGSSSSLYLYAGTANNKIWRCSQETSQWEKIDGFYNLPPEITDLTVKPDEPAIVAAASRGYGVMISFDSGLSYYPAGSVRRSDGTVVHDIFVVSLTDTPLGGGAASLIAGTKEDGAFWREFETSSPLYSDLWGLSTGLTTGEVYDVEYRGPYCEMWAGADSGTYLSSDYGRTWTFDAPSGFSNVYEIGDCYTPKRALNGFTWGARAGVKAPARASGDGSAWLKIGEGSWTVQATAGLDTDCDFEAIHQDSIGVVSAGTVFLGCAYSPTSPWIRVYRGEGCPTVGEPSGTCAWEASDEGMEGTSGAVEAFAKSSNGLLVGVSESSVGAGDGGVFFTDTHSKGYAWVDVSQNGYAMNCKSSTTLTSSGTTLYSGTSCEGAYASTSIDTEGINPVAYYTWGQDEWDDAAFSFDDRSCCDMTGYSWDFSGTFESGPTVVYHYGAGEVVLPTLWGSNASGSDDYTGSLDTPVYIAYLSDVVWSGSDVTVTWERLASDTGFSYEVYRDTDPDGSGRALVQTIPAGDGTWCDAVTCWYTFTDGAAFACYRVRVVP